MLSRGLHSCRETKFRAIGQDLFPSRFLLFNTVPPCLAGARCQSTVDLQLFECNSCTYNAAAHNGRSSSTQEGLDNDEQRVGADIIRRALPYALKLIARNAGVNGSVVVQKVGIDRYC